MSKILSKNQALIEQTVDILTNGGIAALPTETVYGLAVCAKNDDAVKRLFEAKQRPTQQAFSLLIANTASIKDWAVDIPEIAYRLAERFWPGPLTMILPCQDHVSRIITGGKDTIGLRMPDDDFTRAVIKQLGSPVAAPSANITGQPPATNAKMVEDALGDKIDLIIDGGECSVGLSSTIVDLTGDDLKILREGVIKESDLKP